jgi:hypothetical protein
MFGYIADEKVYNATYSAPIFIGEFTANKMSYNYWKYLTDYIKERKLSWAYWSFNDSLLPGTSQSCDASAAPAFGTAGDCTNSLVHGGSCQPTCNTGYTVSGPKSCNDGVATTVTCNKSCDASAAPTNGAAGDCTNSLVHGGSCQPTCTLPYVPSGRTSCNNGTTTPATCAQPKTCTPIAPVNGTLGNCPTPMAAGTSCTPTCNSGFFVQGTTTCNTNGDLGNATCGTSSLPQSTRWYIHHKLK